MVDRQTPTPAEDALDAALGKVMEAYAEKRWGSVTIFFEDGRIVRVKDEVSTTAAEMVAKRRKATS